MYYEVRNNLGVGDVVATFSTMEEAIQFCDAYDKENKDDCCLPWEVEEE